MKVKICGITNLKDALLAEKLGADIIGFIFAESPRKVTEKQALAIIKKLKPFTLKAGVFVEADGEKINRTVKALGLDIAQVHGEVSLSSIRKIKDAKILKVIKAKDANYAASQVKKYKGGVDCFLFDTYDPVLHGGTGKRFDSAILSGVKEPFFIAGGIKPENVMAVLKSSAPYGIDVSSGVEKSKGKKDPVKMKKLFSVINKARW
ncbi:MAG: N-(5'-phosphoribosyl)anthranilate isomerase [Candidatus Aerophobetes bacterium ADurb.Bin490]|nr:MAG: N-(5'-phosphoribosyl)anthranilate isomerase [Candidatus Aerophobetes bacterium ADurb.Bin490]HPI02531.1 phosphoribosylanthranilate isomerase [Candidatus Goldiibacteriota bacterium]HPN64592.1 phosphoribosylanthranilate isomerase [Candidatus Goldiibacteriota bacterium]HRQ43496.1 phosphoribosylanthranilate isomerase [Candidatus Goldiibacteriota bacterium]